SEVPQAPVSVPCGEGLPIPVVPDVQGPDTSGYSSPRARRETIVVRRRFPLDGPMHIPFIKSTGPCRRLLVGWLLALSSLAGAEVLSEDGVEIVYEARDEAVARESLRIVLKAREEMAPRLADSGEPIRIHIASTHAEFQRAAGPGTAPGVGAI